MSPLTRLKFSRRPLAVAALGLMICQALAAGAAQTRLEQSYGKLPLSFEANGGQTDRQVQFLARGPGYALFLTPTEAVLSLKKPQAERKAARKMSALSKPAGGTVLRMRLVGANPAPRIIGREVLPGKVNYLKGRDPTHWHTEIPTYAKVAYTEVYPGIDLVYYGNQRQLEYDFVLAPGANPHLPTLAFEGADRLEIDPRGELVLHTAGGDVRMHKPLIYQEVDGVRQPIGGDYVRKNERQVGFEIAAYDRARPLVIDPVLVYSTYLGGTNGANGFGIAVDRIGQAYVTGSTSSTDFPTQNPLQSALGGGFFPDGFVAKLNRAGSKLVYSTYLGGTDSDAGTAIAVDDSGQAYVTGRTNSTDFPTQNPLQPALGGFGFFDAFVTKLNRAGSGLVYSTYVGGTNFEEGSGIAVDDSGQAYVTGSTSSPDFPTQNPLQPAFGGGHSDAFVAKLNRTGSKLLYSTYLGGTDFDQPFDIAVDRFDHAHVTGETHSSDFPTRNPLQPAFGGALSDAFVAKLNPAGSKLVYSTYLGGTHREEGCFGIAVDRFGRAYVTGHTYSADFPTQDALQPTFGGGSDAFVAKLNRAGSKLVYSTYLGGTDFDEGCDIAVDRFGQAYVMGGTHSTDFPTQNPLQPAFRGFDDAFVAKLNRAGSKLVYSTYLGGTGFDEGRGIAVDRFGQAHVTGFTQSSDFPTQNPLQPAFRGFSDAFVTKIGP